MKNKTTITFIAVALGAAYVYKLSKSKEGILAGLGFTPHSLFSAALPFMGIKNPIIGKVISKGIEGFFEEKKRDRDAIDVEYRRI